MAKFKTRARAVDMLGRQQIAGIPTAISEIFKNAHDAYATSVRADFIRYQNNLLVIRDDGIGMTGEEFLNRWLAIGTDSKMAGGTSGVPFKPKEMPSRPMLGEKGIGRLAIASIGPQVLILSRAKRSDVLSDTVVCFINWRIFESPGLNLDDIDIPVDTYSKGDLPTSEEIELYVDVFRDNVKKLGDKVPQTLRDQIFEDLNSFKIDPEKIDEVLRNNDRIDSGRKDSELTLTGNKGGTHFFVLPADDHLKTEIDFSDDPEGISRLKRTLIGFTNTMKIDEKGKNSSRKNAEIIETEFNDHISKDNRINIIQENEFFTLSDFDLTDHLFEGTFDKKGDFEGEVSVYREKPVAYKIEKTSVNKLTKCGPFKVKFGYVQGVPKESSLEKEDWTFITKKLDTYGGLYIYRNGIRVLPYGNQEFDYLELEKRRTLGAGHYFFSYRRLFGYVELETTNLKEKAGREGFLEDAAYKEFKSLLINLFIRLAADFFRSKGEFSDTFLKRKEKVNQQKKAIKQRAEETKNQRSTLEKALEKFFLEVDSDFPKEECDKCLRTLKGKVAEQEVEAFLGDEQSLALIDLQQDAYKEIDKIEKNILIPEPKIGLAGKLGRDWIRYQAAMEKLRNELFEPTKHEIDKITITTGDRGVSSALLSKKVIEDFRARANKHKLDLRVIQDQVFSEINFDDLQEYFQNIIADFEKESGQMSIEFRQYTQGKDNLFIRDNFEKYKNQLTVLYEKQKRRLEVLKDSLQEAIKIATDKSSSKLSQSELLASYEEQYSSLREEYDDSIELAQIGMAISVINHEFIVAIRDIRQNLRRLGEWAANNKDLRKLHHDLRRGFDHLDEYIKLFSPIQRRFNREEIDIEGNDIYLYLRDVFSDALEKEDIKLERTNAFKEATIRGFPSNIYPVFINLIDNAIYWLQDRQPPRIITLDADGEGVLYVSDNGPGIQIKDKESIFESGVTAKPGGRGLGLKISRDALQRINYRLELMETKGKPGATFRIIPN